eukprot:TRINITY_DN8316_c0_g1_i1.p1 TRINITY_DN8316_c0_g1~~TRINITY_DN8316_c0_g1_i1.p1  ORF type:complete len:603 (+),score=66.30 TRINITY_DN8316_c0_g1_i1:57-1865(+)
MARSLVLLSLVGYAVGLISFSDHVQDHMVLQQQPAKAAVYGTLDTAGTPSVSVEVSGTETYTVAGKVVGSQWVAYLKPSNAGGNYTITVTCTGCGSTGPNTASIQDVTFGDVWYCAGQSNMALPLLHTLSRNISLDAIKAGKYNNIRLHQLSGNMNPSIAWTTALNATELVYQNAPLLFAFSSTCYYFGESLTDFVGSSVPLGLIHTAWGGSTVQQWTSNSTSAKCTNVILDSSSGTWLDSRVMPFANMTLKGFTWYQGENNMGSVFGNTDNNTGYACEVSAMIAEWRELFSSEPGTTDPLAPFGVVTLAPSGTEGHPDIGGMYVAQTGSYGVLPNSAMPNTFLANAFDLGDPFSNTTCYKQGCCPNNIIPGAFCNGCDLYCNSLNATDYYMGPIHPRDKKPVGQRLAQAAYGQVYGGDVQVHGPVISGCSLDGDKLTIKFNQTLLGKESVDVTPYYLPNTASMMQVLTNASLFCIQTTDGPTKDDTLCLDDGTGHQKVFTGVPAKTLQSLSTWPMVNVTVSGTSSITADVSKLGGQVYGLRYAFFNPANGDCCSLNPPTSDPCPVNSCPIKTKASQLPLTPFIAKIENGKCKCIEPQVCDE